MLFGKKKATPANPYYSNGAKTAAPATGAQQQTAAQTQQPVQNIETPQFPVPLLPMPEPISIPNIRSEPFKTGSVSALDMIRMGGETKSFAFVKLSDFKRILDDIKALESKISESQEDLDEFSKVLKQQEEYLARYSTVIRDLRRTIDEIAASLSHVED
jgi:hypothetical protein